MTKGLGAAMLSDQGTILGSHLLLIVTDFTITEG